MSNTEPQTVQIHCTTDGKTTHGTVIRRDRSTSERLKRGGKMFGAFFLGGLITIFVPVLHFILPPLALIIGITLGIAEYMGEGELVEGSIACPNCEKTLAWNHETEGWPRKDRCPGCSYTLTIELDSPLQ